MKNLIITILTAACVVLGVAILVQHGKSLRQIETAKIESTRLSGEISGLRSKVDDQEKVIVRLETDVSKGKEELTAKSQELERKIAELAAAQTNYALAQAELQKQTARITELETQRTGLTEKLEDLQGSITSLEGRIADTKKKLAAAEGDRQELLAQLKKLETEKTQLVAQFNNISVLRTQLAKLREEAAISQRLAWIRTGVYSNQEKKGAQRLIAEVGEKPERTAPGRLDVEVEQNGGARVVPPKSSAPVN